MNAGFSNLATLKPLVLPTGQVATTQFDSLVAGVGLGVAAAIGAWCNRDFAWNATILEDYTAEKSIYVLRRYPYYRIAKVELSNGLDNNGDTQWDDQGIGFILSQDRDSGIVQFAASFTSWLFRLRFTYSGGFWWEPLEPFLPDGVTTTPGYPTTKPTGSALVPPDLFYAWAQQVRADLEAGDILTRIALDGDAKLITPARSQTFLPSVLAVINQYRRFA